MPQERAAPDDVTVVIPAFNREQVLARALRSVGAQSLTPHEVIVSDDASTDNSVEVARSLGARVLTTDVNQGSGPARNRAIEAASTRWIAFLDSDDTWDEDHLATLLPLTGGRVLVAGAATDSHGLHVGNPFSRPMPLDQRLILSTSELVVTSATIVSKDALVRAGLFRPLRRAQDLDMWLRVLDQGPGVAVSRPTIRYYVHAGQASKDTDLMRRCFADIVEDCVGRPWFDDRRDRDRASARLHWDALRSHSGSGPLREAWWLGRHPHTWATVGNLLRIRHARRRRSSAVLADPRVT